MCVMLVKLSDHPRKKAQRTDLFTIKYWMIYAIKQDELPVKQGL